MDHDKIPEGCGEEFFEWLRDTTERAWAAGAQRHHHGEVWQPSTRWSGLSDREIAAAERAAGVRFPPDYRLFLRYLHTVDRPRLDHAGVPVRNCSVFTDWRSRPERVADVAEDNFHGLAFDVAHGVWLRAWGPRPATLDACIARLRDLIADAPPVLPLNPRYLVLESPERAGSPVLSIHQTDIIHWADDLRAYLLEELGFREESPIVTYAGFARTRAVPFWGRFLPVEPSQPADRWFFQEEDAAPRLTHEVVFGDRYLSAVTLRVLERAHPTATDADDRDWLVMLVSTAVGGFRGRYRAVIRASQLRALRVALEALRSGDRHAEMRFESHEAGFWVHAERPSEYTVLLEFELRDRDAHGTRLAFSLPECGLEDIDTTIEQLAAIDAAFA